MVADQNKTSEVEGDPIIAVLKVFCEARKAHDDALAQLDHGVGLSSTSSSQAMLAWRLYQLVDLEIAEVEASSALQVAERAVLTTLPATLAGSAALLGFLRDYLGRVPGMALAAGAIGNAESVLLARS